MPSKEQCEELRTSCTSVWTQQDGVNGRKFTGPNGGTIFLPAPGNRWGDEMYYAGSRGYYWSAALVGGSYPLDAWGLFINLGGVDTNSFYRSYGRSIRPVRNN